MINFFQPGLQRVNITSRHALDYYKRERAFPEIMHELVLPYHRIHVLGQIVQHIVIDTGIGYSQHRRDH